MKAMRIRLPAAGSLACAVLVASCAYPPPYYAERYYTSSPQPPMLEPVGEGYETQPPAAPAPAPGYVGVDPGLVIAGIAAAGLIGYAIADGGRCHGPAYYGPVVYRRGYYGPCY